MSWVIILFMIYDPVLGLIFVKTTKVAGSSFEAAIASFLSPKAIITINEKWSTDQFAASAIRLRRTHWLPLPRLLTQIARHPQKIKSLPLDIIRRRGPRHECFSLETDHMSAQQIRNQIGQAEWDRCLKVVIMRSPYDRIQSDYFMKKNKSSDHVNFPSFDEWLRQNPERILRNKRILELTVKDSRGIQRQAMEIDHIISFENLETGIRDLAKKLKLDENELWKRFTRTRVHSEFRTVESRLNPENLLDLNTKRIIDLLLHDSFDFLAYIKPPNEERRLIKNVDTDDKAS